MTPQTTKDREKSPPEESGEGGAPETEIQVTPEMVDAGADLIGRHFYDITDRESGLVRGLAVEVYLAMARVNPART